MKSNCVLVLPLSLWLLLLTACEKAPPPAPTGPPPIVLPTGYEWLKPSSAMDLIKSTPNLGILDVREDSERNDGSGMLAGAQRLPYFQAPEQELARMDRDRPWLLYCTIGGRSELMVPVMNKLGFKHVYLLRGGLVAWKKQGLPLAQ